MCIRDRVTDVLDEAGLAYEIYSDIKPNPTIENVQTGVAAFKASGADYIIAIGGGSSMAVSYTHLDVYKRQIISRMMELTSVPSLTVTLFSFR